MSDCSNFCGDYSDRVFVSAMDGAEVADVDLKELGEIKKEILGDKYELEIIWSTAEFSATLNKKYRNKDYVPDTLAFPISEDSGQVFLCAESIRNKTIVKGASGFRDRAFYTIIHSMLHLAGFKHGEEMDVEEDKYIEKLKLRIWE